MQQLCAVYGETWLREVVFYNEISVNVNPFVILLYSFDKGESAREKWLKQMKLDIFVFSFSLRKNFYHMNLLFFLTHSEEWGLLSSLCHAQLYRYTLE